MPLIVYVSKFYRCNENAVGINYVTIRNKFDLPLAAWEGFSKRKSNSTETKILTAKLFYDTGEDYVWG